MNKGAGSMCACVCVCVLDAVGTEWQAKQKLLTQ